jgi:hypothetical protein
VGSLTWRWKKEKKKEMKIEKANRRGAEAQRKHDRKLERSS